MRYVDLKKDFIRALVSTGENTVLAAPQELRDRVPESVLRKWADKFYAAERLPEVPRTPRLLNHFKLGADPEFAFTDHGTPLNAEEHGLQSGLAFGADNNGRLVELRPEPSRFALEVVASMLSELRWLSVCRPKLVQTQWKSGAWSGHDGLGGHVHFGRKAVKQKQFEVAALDRLTDMLLKADVFPLSEHQNRQVGQGHYGQFGDTRVQRHGYEYRTAPSWLDSPWKAYLFLTLAKLVVARPEFILSYPASKKMNAAEARKFIRNLLSTFKGIDDDARIAAVGYTVWGMPGPTQTDFKDAWGIRASALSQTAPKVIPGSIKPTQTDIEEVFRHICNGAPLLSHAPYEINWEFHTIPKGWAYPFHGRSTRLCPGLGELLMDMLSPVPLSVRYEAIDRPCIQLSQELLNLVSRQSFLRLKQAGGACQVYAGDPTGELRLTVSRGALTTANFNGTRELLTNGLLPLVRFRHLSRCDKDAWSARLAKSLNSPAPRSVQLTSMKF